MKKFLLIVGLFFGSSLGFTQTRVAPYVVGNATPGDCVQYDTTSTATSPVLADTGSVCGSGGGGGSGNFTTTPGAGVNQNVVQQVGTQASINNFSNIRYVTASYNWSQIISINLSTPSSGQTATLTPCPLGIDTSANSNKPYYIYIPTINAEAALITGGSCTSGAASGTVIFTTTVAHSATSNTLQSAYAGLQEAINDGGGNFASIIVPPSTTGTNALQIYAPIQAQSSHTYIEGNGALLNCHTRSRCLLMGDLVSSGDVGDLAIHGFNFTSSITADGCQITNTSLTSNIVTITVLGGCSTIQTGDTVVINFTDNVAYWGVHGPVTVSGTTITYTQTSGNITTRSTPGTIAIENAAIEDNAFPGTIDMIRPSSFAGGKFNEFIVVDNDQALTIRNLDANAGLECTANHCGSYVYSAGNSSIAPVIWVDNSNISPQCGGNGITIYANNTVRVTNTVIQGMASWGTNTSTRLGSFGGTTLTNVYNEAGSCTNAFHPFYPSSSYAVNSVGDMYQGNNQPIEIAGGEQPNGILPVFLNTGTTGSTVYDYYIVVHDNGSFGGTSAPLLAGQALTNGTSGNITVQWPRVPPNAPGNTVTYDIIRMQIQNVGSQAINYPVNGSCTGGSMAACGSVTTAQAQCSSLVCTYTDSDTATTSSYTVTQPNYFPLLNYWPGALVLYSDGGSNNVAHVGEAHIDTDKGVNIISWFVSEAAFLKPSIYARQCNGTNNTSIGGAWIQCLEGSNNTTEVGALLLSNVPGANNAPATNVKGRLNFIFPPTINSEHIITLLDSNPSKTLATSINRPSNDANDTYIGLDQGNVSRNLAQLAFGAPVAISNYIGNIGDNTSFLERLTNSLKFFGVPVKIQTSGPSSINITPNFFASLPACAGGVEGSYSSVLDSTTNLSGTVIVGGGSFHVAAYCNGTNWIVVTGAGALSLGTTAQIPIMNSLGTAYVPETLSGDSILSSVGVMTNIGLEGVPFCTGFAPTNGQVLQYTTGGSPNPCYTASASGGSTVTVNGGSAITAPNFNATTPAAGSNNINITWQQSGNSVSAEIPTTGNGTTAEAAGTVGASQPIGCSDVNSNFTTSGCMGLQIFTVTTFNNFTPTGTSYWPLNGAGAGSSALSTTAEAAIQTVLPRAGTMTALYARVTNAEGVSATLTFTLRLNHAGGGSTSQTLTCTIPNSGTTCNDTTAGHAFSWSAGDTMDVQVIQSGTGTNQTISFSMAYF